MSEKKKLIEVALPLDVINDASAYDKMPGIGPHPKGIHHWWARLPLPSARAMLFASLVDDPSSDPAFSTKSEREQEEERERLFGIIRTLCQKKIYQHPEAYKAAEKEIRRCCEGRLPIAVDPFCGGGSIPLEAQRLGLEVHGSDLNPVAVLISKASIELVPKFAGLPPINSEDRSKLAHSGAWTGVAGLSEDVRYYGMRMREEAQKRIGHLYPKVRLPQSMGGAEASVIAWIWARTVKCPNPACGAQMPLVSTFSLATKKGKQAWVVPQVDSIRRTIHYAIQTGDGVPPSGTKVGRQKADFRCLVCEEVAQNSHVKSEGKQGRMGTQLMAIVADGGRGRVYLPATEEHERIAKQAEPTWVPTTHLPEQALGFRVQAYGMTSHADLFTQRQLTSLSTLSDLIPETRQSVRADFVALYGENGADAYADAIITFLAFSIDRCSDFNSSLCGWSASNEKVMHLFGRQAIPMIWDFSEANILADTVGSWSTCAEYVADCVRTIWVAGSHNGNIRQMDAAKVVEHSGNIIASSDPPYYDAIGYADLADFFYVWLRHSLQSVYPDLLRTILTPKMEELVADPKRYNGSHGAMRHFEDGFRNAFTNLKSQLDPRFPLTVYYAFKQKDEEVDEGMEEDGLFEASTTNSGWETLLEALVSSGFQITGTWPIRASQKWRMRSIGANALASYIVLVSRPRAEDAPIATKREFINALRRELTDALLLMMHGNIAPVDLAQATIGPGMAVYSRYSKVIETDGKPLSIHTALQIINQELASILSADEGSYDSDTRFCLAWYELYGMDLAEFGEADVLARAKGTSVQGLERGGVLEQRSGKVRLLKREELPANWNPKKDERVPVWECTQQLVRNLLEQGESGAGRLCALLGGKSEAAHELAYRLFTLCERKGWTQEALAYNSLATSWSEIKRLASNSDINLPNTGLFAEGEN